MKIHLLGLFTESLEGYFSASLLGKARKQGLLEFHYHQLRDWGQGSHKMVDDKPYGGGQGMVMLPEVVCRAVRELRRQHSITTVVATAPAGKPFTAQVAKSLSQKDSVLFLCGRYEGVDQRALDAVVDECYSVGDYVLSGGELAAAVMTDAMCRFVPGVVAKTASVEEDSYEQGLLEHPHYTRPENFEGMAVPEVLLSGHHQNIADWRRKESLLLTWQRRPDLLKKAKLSPKEIEDIKNYIHGRS